MSNPGSPFQNSPFLSAPLGEKVKKRRAPPGPQKGRHLSCQNCRAGKTKCSRTFPCTTCNLRGQDCVWLDAQPSRSGHDLELEQCRQEIARLNRVVDMLYSHAIHGPPAGGAAALQGLLQPPASQSPGAFQQHQPQYSPHHPQLQAPIPVHSPNSALLSVPQVHRPPPLLTPPPSARLPTPESDIDGASYGTTASLSSSPPFPSFETMQQLPPALSTTGNSPLPHSPLFPQPAMKAAFSSQIKYQTASSSSYPSFFDISQSESGDGRGASGISFQFLAREAAVSQSWHNA
ncbi:hypothetical protein T439DRAFT_335927 [Meredithblackwellia eburnea MCA 4105]